MVCAELVVISLTTLTLQNLRQSKWVTEGAMNTGNQIDLESLVDMTTVC